MRSKTKKYQISKSKTLVLLLLILFIKMGYTQQDPIFTQYQFNTQTYNPAYAGTWKSLGFLVLGRNQWTGMEGAPQTYTFSLQTNTKNDKVGLGINLINDKIGLENRFGLFGDYSYGLKINAFSILRLGVKFGVSNYRNDLSAYNQYPGQQDPTLMGDIENHYLPNFGVGAFMYAEKYYIGFSIPKILENSIEDENSSLYQTEVRQFYLMGGYVANFSESVQFKPTFLTKAIVGAPIQFDISANFLLAEKVWLGAMYRVGDAFGFIAQWIFDKQF